MILPLVMKECLQKAKLDSRRLPNACIVLHAVQSFILIWYVNIIIAQVLVLKEREREREREREKERQIERGRERNRESDREKGH